MAGQRGTEGTRQGRRRRNDGGAERDGRNEAGQEGREGWSKARVLGFNSRALKWHVVGKDCRAASQISSIRVCCAFRVIWRDAFPRTLAPSPQ